MIVNLSEKSWHSRYYNFVKGYYPDNFKSLCPYFWTIISYILLSPVIILWKLFKILLKLTVNPIQKIIVKGVGKSLFGKPYSKREPSKISKWYDRNEKKIETWGQRFYFGFFGLIFLIFLLIGLISLFKDKGLYLGFVFIFTWIGILTTFIFIMWGIVSFFETDTWDMIKGMIYSTKNKVCPMIVWEEKDEN